MNEIRCPVQRKHEISAGVYSDYHYYFCVEGQCGLGGGSSQSLINSGGRSTLDCWLSWISRLGKLCGPGIPHSVVIAGPGKGNCSWYELITSFSSLTCTSYMSVGPGSETHCICRSFIFVFIVQDATCTILKGHLASVKIALRERCCAQIETVGGSKNSGMENGASQQSRNCIAMGRLLSFSDLQKKTWEILTVIILVDSTHYLKPSYLFFSVNEDIWGH